MRSLAPSTTLPSIATGIVVLSCSPVEVRFHEHVEEVLEWLPVRHEQMTGVKLDLDRLRRMLLKASSALDAPTPSAIVR
jgi:hypothetical protein